MSSNPMYLWLTVAWLLSKLYQFIIGDAQTVWEKIWLLIVDFLGKFLFTTDATRTSYMFQLSLSGNDQYAVITMGTGTFAFIVGIGISAVFTFMDFFVMPENIRKYKIQPNTNEPPDYRKFRRVIDCICTSSAVSLNEVLCSVFPGGASDYFQPNFCELSDVFRVLLRNEVAKQPRLENFGELPNRFHERFRLAALLRSYILYVPSTAASQTPLQAYPQDSSRVDGEYCNNCALLASHRAFDGEFVVSARRDHLHRLSHRDWMGLDWTSAYVNPHRPLWISHSLHAFIWVSRLPSSQVSGSEMVDQEQRMQFPLCRFNLNYGGTGMMDSFFGTDKTFHSTIHAKRHRTLFSLKSARERFPDPPTQKDD